MSYVPEIPEDCIEHAEYHANVTNDVLAAHPDFENVIWSQGSQRIVVVNFHSHIEIKRLAERVGRCAKKDAGYDFLPYSAAEEPDERNMHLFLAIAEYRCIGLLIAEILPNIFSIEWNNQNQIPLPNHLPLWTIGLIWMHQEQRRRGWASRLVMEAARFFKLSSTQDIGWRMPFSNDGRAFARRICPICFYTGAPTVSPPNLEAESILRRAFGAL